MRNKIDAGSLKMDFKEKIYLYLLAVLLIMAFLFMIIYFFISVKEGKTAVWKDKKYQTEIRRQSGKKHSEIFKEWLKKHNKTMPLKSEIPVKRQGLKKENKKPVPPKSVQGPDPSKLRAPSGSPALIR